MLKYIWENPWTLFIIFGLLVWLSLPFVGGNVVQKDMLSEINGTIASIYYDKGRAENRLLLSLKNHSEQYILRSIRHLKRIYNGCTVPALHSGVNVTLLFDPENYTIWSISQGGREVVSYQESIQARENYKDYIAMYAKALFFGGIFLKILFTLFPGTEAFFGRRR